MTEVKKFFFKKKYPNVPENEVRLALAVEEKLGLDFTLGHLVILERKDRKRGTSSYNVYITRDGLLYLMHKMGKPWSLKMDKPVRQKNPYTGKEDVWLEGELSVYDPETGVTQTYRGGVWLSEYQARFGSWQTHPGSMHFKVAEVFLYRRATNVSLTPVEEMDRVLEWDSADSQSGPSQPGGGRAKPSRSSNAASGEKITRGTLRKVEALLKAAGYTSETADKARQKVAEVLGLAKPPSAIKELTEAQGKIFVERVKDGLGEMIKEEVVKETNKPSPSTTDEPEPKDAKEGPAKQSLDDEFPPPEAFE